MKQRTLIALSIAAVFALPLTTQAAGDKEKSASSGASQGSSGAEKMFQTMDKNKDGSVSLDEAKGTPHEKDFAKLDKNNDGKLSREEHAAAPEHAKEKAGTGGTSGASGSGSSSSGSSSQKKY